MISNFSGLHLKAKIQKLGISFGQEVFISVNNRLGTSEGIEENYELEGSIARSDVVERRRCVSHLTQDAQMRAVNPVSWSHERSMTIQNEVVDNCLSGVALGACTISVTHVPSRLNRNN